MNYKVMQRPMFKMGGKAASQGTGITSGLDERVNYSKGAFGTGRSIEELQGMDLADLIGLQTAGYDKSMQGLSDMRDIVRLQTLGNLATNVLPNIERGGLTGVVDFLKDPTTTQQAISGLTGLKRVDLKEKELQGKGLDKFIKGKMAVEQLDIAKQKATVLTATQVRVNSGNQARQILRDNNVTNPNDLTDPILKDQYYELKNIADGRLTPSEARQIATKLVNENSNKAKEDTGIGYDAEEFQSAVDAMVSVLLGGNAEGGMPNRVNRAMGSGEDGEPIRPDPTKPINPFGPKPTGPVLPDKKMAFDDTPRFELRSLSDLLSEFEADNRRGPTSIDELKRYFYNKYGPDFLSQVDQAVANESKDVAMETQGQGKGNQVFDMLRARLPQEITDDVVQLISYDKTAFADFASIKNQEDVTSFNDKYGTQLVIDVATV